MSKLTFDELRARNVERARRWHGAFPDDDWSGADWSNALAGEVGEAANIIKKLRRHETGHPGANDPGPLLLRVMLAAELADIQIYLDLLAAKYGIDLGEATIQKFNAVSVREGFPERVCPRMPHELWRQAHDEHPEGGEAADRLYHALMVAEGHLIPKADA